MPDVGAFGPPSPDLSRKCPDCGSPMGFRVDTDGTQSDLTRPAPLPPPQVWECPQCGLESRIKPALSTM